MPFSVFLLHYLLILWFYLLISIRKCNAELLRCSGGILAERIKDRKKSHIKKESTVWYAERSGTLRI